MVHGVHGHYFPLPLLRTNVLSQGTGYRRRSRALAQDRLYVSYICLFVGSRLSAARGMKYMGGTIFRGQLEKKTAYQYTPGIPVYTLRVARGTDSPQDLHQSTDFQFDIFFHFSSKAMYNVRSIQVRSVIYGGRTRKLERESVSFRRRPNYKLAFARNKQVYL